MDKDRLEGSANQAKGAIKEAAGKITGDSKLQAEGAADKAVGKVQNAVGGVKDAIRDAANLYMFSNTISIVRVNGAVLKDWLEHAARVFLRVDPDNPASQPLLDLRAPSYNFDVIAGLTYEIDLSQPQRTDINGRIIAEQAHRIVDLRYQGQPLDPQREFLVVTNNYRAGGGGHFPSIDGSHVVMNDATANRDALIAFIRKSGRLSVLDPSPWRFKKPTSPLRVWFDSAPIAASLASQISGLHPIGQERVGYMRFEIRS